jgi:hypothetical protein
MLRIVTDGGADMPDGWEQDFDISLLPLRIRFGEEDFVQGVNIDKNSFYQMVAEKKMIPNTSLPSPQQVADFYRGLLKRVMISCRFILPVNYQAHFQLSNWQRKKLRANSMSIHLIPGLVLLFRVSCAVKRA